VFISFRHVATCAIIDICTACMSIACNHTAAGLSAVFLLASYIHQLQSSPLLSVKASASNLFLCCHLCHGIRSMTSNKRDPIEVLIFLSCYVSLFPRVSIQFAAIKLIYYLWKNLRDQFCCNFKLYLKKSAKLCASGNCAENLFFAFYVFKLSSLLR
jgi:hypothetical protein